MRPNFSSLVNVEGSGRGVSIRSCVRVMLGLISLDATLTSKVGPGSAARSLRVRRWAGKYVHVDAFAKFGLRAMHIKRCAVRSLNGKSLRSIAIKSPCFNFALASISNLPVRMIDSTVLPVAAWRLRGFGSVTASTAFFSMSAPTEIASRACIA